ncbi:MAG: xylulose kinase [Anaerolineae bacterium]|nr:xylulose kinase [Anaerolineae bacterium]
MQSDKSKYIFTIDLGKNGPKVALISTTGEVIAHEFEENDVILLPNGGAEQDPDDWWQAISKSAQRLVAKNQAQIKDVVAVSCTSQWSGTVAVDQEGNPLMNAIIWMDTRGEPYVNNVAGGGIQVEGYAIPKMIQWISKTGGAPAHSGKDPIAHILYIQNELPEIYEKTYKFLEPKDYLNLKLTGKFAASYDSIALHWVTDNRDIDNIVYDDALFKITTLERGKLPELKRAVDLLGDLKADVASELGLPEGTPVVMGTPDVHSAAIGSGAVKDFEGHLYVGTSSWLTCHVPFKKTDVFHGMGSLPSPIPGRYLLLNEQESAGACLKFLKDSILYHEDELLTEANVPDIYKVFDQVAANAPAGSGKLIFTPWLYGERTPIEDHTIRGGFHNMSLQTTREHLIRAVFEGVAYNTKWLLKYAEKFISRRMDVLNIIGGGANSALWCQIFADVLDRDICQVKDPIHANSRGAALLASVALGHSTFDDISEQTQIVATYHPNPENREIYDELFDEFLGIYKRNKTMYARLNG